MKRIKKIFIYILIIAGAFIVSHIPTRTYIRNHTYYFLANLNNNGLFGNSEIDHYYLNSINATTEGNTHYLTIKVKRLNLTKINSITINEITYYNNEIKIDLIKNTITIELSDYVTFEDNAYFPILINNIRVYGDIYSIDYQTYLFKEIDSSIIEQTKSAMVSVLGGNDTTSSWGSGIIFRRENRGLFYDYYVLTNHHVVRDKTKFYIYYEKEGSTTLSRSTATHITSDFVSDDIDLAILKFSTTDNLNHIGNNNQFKTFIPQTIVLNQPVFIVASPEGKNTYFNTVKEGLVIEEHLIVILENSEVCNNGCKAFQTDISLKSGSSGGGTFDANGQLVGIHFAGPKDYSTSSSIPMDVVLDFIQSFFNTVYYEKSPNLDFFYSTT